MVASLFYLCHTRRCACSSAGCSGPGLAHGDQYFPNAANTYNGLPDIEPSLSRIDDFSIQNFSLPIVANDTYDGLPDIEPSHIDDDAPSAWSGGGSSSKTSLREDESILGWEHAMLNHPSLYTRCITCHRTQKCNPKDCEYCKGRSVSNARGSTSFVNKETEASGQICETPGTIVQQSDSATAGAFVVVETTNCENDGFDMPPLSEQFMQPRSAADLSALKKFMEAADPQPVDAAGVPIHSPGPLLSTSSLALAETSDTGSDRGPDTPSSSDEYRPSMHNAHCSYCSSCIFLEIGRPEDLEPQVTHKANFLTSWYPIAAPVFRFASSLIYELMFAFCRVLISLANSYSNILSVFVLLLLISVTYAMDPDETNEAGHSFAFSGVGIGFTIIAGAAVRSVRFRGGDQETRQRNIRPRIDSETSVPEALAMEGLVAEAPPAKVLPVEFFRPPADTAMSVHAEHVRTTIEDSEPCSSPDPLKCSARHNAAGCSESCSFCKQTVDPVRAKLTSRG